MRQNRWRFAIAMVVLVLIAGACSSRDDDTATEDGTTDSSAEEETESSEPEETESSEPEDEVALEATEVGVSETEIRLGVIADVDTPLAPGLSQPLIDGVQAWVDQVNADGGLAGREIVLTSYDSKLNPDEAVNAILEACENEFALVGSGMFALLNPAPLIECADVNGDPTGLPDLAALAVSPGQGASPVSFPMLPVGQDFAAEVPTYNTLLYGAPYIEELLGEATPKVLSVDPGTPGVRLGVVASNVAYGERGWEDAGVVTFPDSAPQSEALPIVNQIREQGINVVNGISFGTAKIMAEARVQGVDVDSIVWLCTSQCLSPGFAAANAEVADGMLVSQSNAPYSDVDVAAIGEYVSGVDPAQVSNNGLFAFSAGKAFEELIAQLVEEDGMNGLTRASLFKVLGSGFETSAGGILSEGSVLGAQSECWVTSQLVDGAFQRADPPTSGEFRCDPEVRTTVVDPQE